MNYAKTSGAHATGHINWSQANNWANNLVYGGYADWRLPTLTPSDTSCLSVINPGGGFLRRQGNLELDRALVLGPHDDGTCRELIAVTQVANPPGDEVAPELAVGAQGEEVSWRTPYPTCRRTRSAQMPLCLIGAFWLTILPLLHESRCTALTRGPMRASLPST